MSELINTPLFLSLAFPALTVLGMAPLLRWALSGEKTQIYASLSIGLACIIAFVCAYGRIDGTMAFGPSALPYGIGVVSLTSLLYCLYVQNVIARLLLAVFTIFLWCWLLVGGPLNEAALFPVLKGAVGLSVFSYALAFRNRIEASKGHTPSVLISLCVATFSLGLMSLSSQMPAAYHFSLALFVISLCGLVLSYPRFGFSFQENGLLPLSLCSAGLAWMLWVYAGVPVISLLCIGLIFFARPATEKLLENGPKWLSKAYYVFLSLFCMLPAVLGLVFYDVLRAF